MKTSLTIVLAAAALMVSVTGAAIAHPSKGVSINYPKLDVAPSPLPPGPLSRSDVSLHQPVPSLGAGWSSLEATEARNAEVHDR